MKCLFQSLGKTSHETTYLITYKYIREYWLTKNTFFFGYYLSCPYNSESYRTFFWKNITERASKQLLEKSCAKLFFFLIVMENDLWIVLNCHRNIIK